MNTEQTTVAQPKATSPEDEIDTLSLVGNEVSVEGSDTEEPVLFWTLEDDEEDGFNEVPTGTGRLRTAFMNQEAVGVDGAMLGETVRLSKAPERNGIEAAALAS